MVIALDYDDTYTADPELWDLFIEAAHNKDHTIIIVTGRHESDPIKYGDVPVIYSGNIWKSVAAERAGYHVDIWIDDMPGMIERSRKLEW